MNLEMISKIVNILVIIITVEISILLGVYLLTFEVFWFYMGITITLTIFILILIFNIVMSSSQSDYSDEIMIGAIKFGSKREYEGSTNFSLPQVVNEAKELREVVLAQETNSKIKVLELTNQFSSLIKDIKSRIDQKRVQIEVNELSRKFKDEYISDIKKTFEFEIEKLKISFGEKIDKFSIIEDTLNSKLENFGNSISKDFNHKFETALGNLTQNLKIELPVKVKSKKESKPMDLTKEITPKIGITPKPDQKLEKVKDKEIASKKQIEKTEPITNTPKGAEYDGNTEKLINYVKIKYKISSDESIELLQKIEVHLGKDLNNKEYRSYFIGKTLDDLTKMFEKRPRKEKEKKKTPKRETKEESINLIGREIEILKINEDIQEIDHKGTKFKMQKTMGGKTLGDFWKMEERIKKFFKTREILIVYCKNIEKYFIYYKK
ncbi:hypothetical protein LCGC14_0640630 [marine sediment metagenome]|uniref:Uncharacterized protein n=1 Tax=marine sediment metagenome TaxID=412755 RepID=A0A0F9TKP9_9ZZZZ